METDKENLQAAQDPLLTRWLNADDRSVRDTKKITKEPGYLSKHKQQPKHSFFNVPSHDVIFIPQKQSELISRNVFNTIDKEGSKIFDLLIFYI